jgi:mevalonate kinase
MGKGSGFGKVILFGEHFVVHGVPGIVSAIDSTTEAEVRKTGSQIVVKDERKTARGYSQEKKLQQLESIDRMLKKMGIKQETALEIWIGGTLPGFSGLGASAVAWQWLEQ